MSQAVNGKEKKRFHDCEPFWFIGERHFFHVCFSGRRKEIRFWWRHTGAAPHSYTHTHTHTRKRPPQTQRAPQPLGSQKGGKRKPLKKNKSIKSLKSADNPVVFCLLKKKIAVVTRRLGHVRCWHFFYGRQGTGRQTLLGRHVVELFLDDFVSPFFSESGGCIMKERKKKE